MRDLSFLDTLTAEHELSVQVHDDILKKISNLVSRRSFHILRDQRKDLIAAIENDPMFNGECPARQKWGEFLFEEHKSPNPTGFEYFFLDVLTMEDLTYCDNHQKGFVTFAPGTNGNVLRHLVRAPIGDQVTELQNRYAQLNVWLGCSRSFIAQRPRMNIRQFACPQEDLLTLPNVHHHGRGDISIRLGCVNDSYRPDLETCMRIMIAYARSKDALHDGYIKFTVEMVEEVGKDDFWEFWRGLGDV